MMLKAWSLMRLNCSVMSSHCWSPCSPTTITSRASSSCGSGIWTSSCGVMMYECEMAENHLMYPAAMSRPVGAGRPKSCALSTWSRYYTQHYEVPHGDGLDITKLAQHPPPHISDVLRSLFEPSKVKTNLHKQTCLALALIHVHENGAKIHVIQMRSCGICDNMTL